MIQQPIKLATMCSGIGSPEYALKELGVPHEIPFACEIDKYARESYLANYVPFHVYHDMTKENWDLPEQYSDGVVAGIPCQAFSLAGKRMGEDDEKGRGVLFYDFYRYVKNQQPKFFIIENVKGLLSDNKGITFQNWVQLLGRSVNNHEQMFLHPDSLEYNLHHTVLNAKNFGLPQNRERVFIVGIRKDLPNNFRFPVGEALKLRLKDILEPIVEEKYYLSDKFLAGCLLHKERHEERGNGFLFKPKSPDEIANTVSTNMSRQTDTFIREEPKIIVHGETTPNSQAGKVYSSEGLSPTVLAGSHGYALGYITDPKAARQTGRNPENPKSRKSGIPLEQTIEINDNPDVTNTITTVQKDNLVVEPKILQKARGFNDGGLHDICPPITASSFQNNNHVVESPTPVPDELVVAGHMVGGMWDKTHESSTRVYDSEGIAPTVNTGGGGGHHAKAMHEQRIRRLTPLECFRLQGYSDEFFYSCKYLTKAESEKILLKHPNHKGKRIFSHEERIERMSDSQLYKQAGNSIATKVMKAVFSNLLYLFQ